VTSVDECTRAETGVGADMASGNQAENGKRADLVIDVIITKKIREGVGESQNKQAGRVRKKKTSPRRLVSPTRRPPRSEVRLR